VHVAALRAVASTPDVVGVTKPFFLPGASGGFVATANHNILPEGYKHTIGYEFAAPFRFQRVRDLLTSKDKWELDQFRGVQQDSLSLPGLALARRPRRDPRCRLYLGRHRAQRRPRLY